MGNCSCTEVDESNDFDYFSVLGKTPIYSNPNFILGVVDFPNSCIEINLDMFRLANKKMIVQLDMIENSDYEIRYQGRARNIDVKLKCVRPNKLEISQGIICFFHLVLSYSGHKSVHSLVTAKSSSILVKKYV